MCIVGDFMDAKQIK